MLHIHRAERADGLVVALGALLVDPLHDPFAAEVVAVPTRGMERWLTQRMSAYLGAMPGRCDGVCANIAFPSPRRLVGDAVATALDIQPDADAWLPERAVWPLLEVVEDCLGEPWLHSLSVHVGGGAHPADAVRRSRRLTRVRHLADLFDRYALHRPEMVLAWARGRDTDGVDSSLPGQSSWQAELWRRLRDRIALPSPAERLQSACARLHDDPGLVELPKRISLFGLTRLPAGHLRVLRALATSRDVHLFLLHPSPALWERVGQSAGAQPRIVRRSADVTTTLPVNRLLASWGQDAREMQVVLAATEDRVDHHHVVAHGAGTLLAHIQADVRANRPSAGPPLPGEPDKRPTLHPHDRSLQIHSCHGRARQVEIIRDAILHLLKQDPTLEPRDVIVMCPDIEMFAPLIQATFGAGEVDDAEQLGALPAEIRPPDLRVRLADRSLRQTNPVLGVVAELIDLAEQRLTASQVLDLADREPVRRRFLLGDEDLTRLQGWVSQSGIRWGFDAAHRAPFKLDALSSGTWRTGLDRILVGVTMTEDQQQLFAGVLPLDDVESGAIGLAGRFAEFVDRLQESIAALSRAKTIDAWAAAIATAADSLTTTSQRDSWQRNELQRLLDDVVAEATVAGTVAATRISPPEIRALLGDRLQGRPTRANFRTGHLTICTLVPMRSVPHRVVCLLGLDDGVFPRKALRDGDDLMVEDPHVGDRDPRAEDRQMLLDALLAATDRLIVTYSGNDERTNAPRPPAVPVGELLDVVNATVRTEDGDAQAHVVVRHPLQPFAPRNFVHGALVGDQIWSFDPVTLAGARALIGTRAEPGTFLAGPLPRVEESLVEIEDLVRFCQHPVRAFLRRRLGVSVTDFSDEAQDDLRVELDGLGKWGVGQRLLDARLAGVDARTAVMAEIARGTLPPGVLGQPVIEEVFPIVDLIVSETQALVDGAAPTGSMDVRLVLCDGRWLSGTVPGVNRDVVRTVTYSRVAAKHRIASWVRLLALTAAHPKRAFEAQTIGRSAAGPGVTIAQIRPLGPDARTRRHTALCHLATLMDLYDRGMREPLALYCATSAAYAQAAAAGVDPLMASRRAWTSEWNFDREDKEPEHQLVLSGVRTFDELLQERPRSREQGGGWEMTEPTRLGRCARRMWDGLLAHEKVTCR
ncbi:MAG TPA: exodeoxyribonuclease V subunit gamma [Solirubrobacteraceae bacterium]